MAVVHWSERVPLDLDGVRLLGASLYLREVWLEELTETWKAIPESLRPLTELTETSKAIPESLQLLTELDALDTPDQVYIAAKTATISSFRFEWHHLFHNQWLVPYLKPVLPEFSIFVDQDEPISALQNDITVGSLNGIFKEEWQRQCDLRLKAPVNTAPYPCSEAEILFYLCNADVIEVPAGDGAPKGRRYKDNLSEAVDYAWSIRHEKQCSRREAVMLSLDKFTIVSIGKFLDGDGTTNDSIVVANGEDAAFKRVYEALAKVEKKEPAINQTPI